MIENLPLTTCGFERTSIGVTLRHGGWQVRRNRVFCGDYLNQQDALASTRGLAMRSVVDVSDAHPVTLVSIVHLQPAPDGAGQTT